MKVNNFAGFVVVLLLAAGLSLFAGGRKEERNMISLNMLTNGAAGGSDSVTIAASFLSGQQLSYTFELYQSVGNDADYRILDESILAFVERKENYLNPKQMRKGMTGADDAEGTFVFKAVKSGNTTLIIRLLFRGDVEKELIFNITVE